MFEKLLETDKIEKNLTKACVESTFIKKWCIGLIEIKDTVVYVTLNHQIKFIYKFLSCGQRTFLH